MTHRLLLNIQLQSLNGAYVSSVLLSTTAATLVKLLLTVYIPDNLQLGSWKMKNTFLAQEVV